MSWSRKKQDLVGQQQLAQLRAQRGRERLAQVDARDLGAEARLHRIDDEGSGCTLRRLHDDASLGERQAARKRRAA
jgi:hypothetical protein